MSNETQSQLLEELEIACKRHDWYYQYSDDMRWWSAGNESINKISKMMDTLRQDGLGAEAVEIYNQYSPWKLEK